VLSFTVTGASVDPKPRFWIFVLAQETRRPNLEASPSIAERGAEVFLPVNEESDIVGIVNVHKEVLTDLNTNFMADVLNDEIHCSAKQRRGQGPKTHPGLHRK